MNKEEIKKNPWFEAIGLDLSLIENQHIYQNRLYILAQNTYHLWERA